MKSKNLLFGTLLFAGTLFTTSEVLASTCKAPQPTICTRSCWTAKAGSCTTGLGALTRAIIHHTAGSGDYTTDYETAKSKVRGVQNYHMSNNGWCDIGYHFLVSAGGHIFEGRDGSMSSLPRGAHDGCNADSFGFTALGYFHSPYNHDFTTTIQNALYNVIAWRMPNGWSPYGSGSYCSVTVGRLDGHRKVKATACPGDIIWAHIGTDYNGGNARNGVASRRACSSKTARTVDNDSSGFSASSNWILATSAADKHGADYRYRSTEAVSDAAQWSTSLNTSASWTVRAWWSQGSNRSASAPYIVSHDGGTSTIYKNQQANGGSWQTLGSWTMGGSQNVKLSCWTTTGYVVIADAIRWE
jgi:hypothetical protein